MKKIKTLIIIAMCLSFVGCKEYGEKRIVNFITIDDAKIAVYYDDFSKENPEYVVEERKNNGISNTLVRLLSEADYDLKLCKFAVVSKDILDSNINELFFALTDSRFAPDIVILEGETDLSPKEYEKIDKLSYPLYNYKIQNNAISCVVERVNDNEKNIIIDNKIYKRLTEQQSFVFDILSQTIKNGRYIFECNNEILSVELDKIKVYYYVKNDTVHINITAVMKNYKGASSNKNDKKSVEKMVEHNISKRIKELLYDTLITTNFNLLCGNNAEGCKKTEVNINIL